MGKKRTHARGGNGSFDHINRSSALRLFVFFSFVFACCFLTGGSSLFAQNRFPIRHEVPGKAPLYGFINRWGKVVIPPQFAQVQDFDSDYCACQDLKTGHWGLIDTTGKWVITPRYAAILTPFRCGVGAVGTATKDSTLQYVNLKGEVIFQSPHIWVNLWNPETKTYDGVRPFFNNFALYGKADPNFPQVRILTTKGKFLTKDAYYSASEFHGLLFRVEIKKGVFAYLNAEGVLSQDSPEKINMGKIFDHSYCQAYQYSDGFIVITSGVLFYSGPAREVSKSLTGTNHTNLFYLTEDYVKIYHWPIHIHAGVTIIAFGEKDAPPNYHRNPIAYYDINNGQWIWKKERAPGKMQDISGTYLFFGGVGKPTETLVLKCPQKDVLEAYYYSSSGISAPEEKRELIKLEVKDYRPTDRSFLLKFKGFKTYYPCVLRDTHTLILNNPENKLQDFVRVKY